MRTFLLSIVLGLAAATAIAQTDNTLFVKQFPGNDVGTKVTRAIAACNPDTTINCIVIIDPSLAKYQAGTLPTIPSNVTLKDCRALGSCGDKPNPLVCTGSGATQTCTLPGTLTAGTANTTEIGNGSPLLLSGCGAGTYAKADGTGCGSPAGPTASYTCLNSAGDQTVIQNLLNAANAAGGQFIFLNSSSATPCQLSSHLTIYSNTTLQGPAVLQYSPSSADYLIGNNQNAQTVQRTFTDAVTAVGSTTISSASGAAFTAADIGQSLECDGVYGVGTGWNGATISTNFHTTITKVASGTSATMADPANVAFTSGSPTTCRFYTRDTNITLRNLTLMLGGISQGAGALAVAKFKTIDGLLLDNISTWNGVTGVASSSGGYQIHILDASNWAVINPTFHGWYGGQDGLHVVAPSRSGTLVRPRGHSGDDLISICESDGVGTGLDNTVQGTIDGILLDDIDAESYSWAGVKFCGVQAATSQPMYTRNVTVRHIHSQPYNAINTWGGFSNFMIIADGIYDNINMEDVEGSPAPSGSVFATSPSATGSIQIGRMNFNGIYPLNWVGGPPFTVQQTSIADMTINRFIGTAGVLGGNNLFKEDFLSAGNFNVSVIGRLQFTNSQYDGITGGVPLFLLSGTVNDLIWNNVQLNYNLSADPGTIGIIQQQPGVIGTASFNGVHVTHSTNFRSGVGLLFSAAFSGTNPVTGAVNMNDVSLAGNSSGLNEYLMYLSVASTSYSFQNVNLNYMAGCIGSGTLGVPNGAVLNVMTANMGGTAGCGAQSGGIPNLLTPIILTNQTATIGHTVFYTAPATVTANTLIKFDCTLSTGGTTGSGNVQIFFGWNSSANFANSPSFNLTSNNYEEFHLVAPAVSSGKTMSYGFNYTSTGSYNVYCQPVQYN